MEYEHDMITDFQVLYAGDMVPVLWQCDWPQLENNNGLMEHEEAMQSYRTFYFFYLETLAMKLNFIHVLKNWNTAVTFNNVNTFQWLAGLSTGICCVWQVWLTMTVQAWEESLQCHPFFHVNVLVFYISLLFLVLRFSNLDTKLNVANYICFWDWWKVDV
jgi:hypothetical protein